MATNLGYYFYHDYYRDFFDTESSNQQFWKEKMESPQLEKQQKVYFREQHERLFKASEQIQKAEYETSFHQNLQQFRLRTIYPGMLIGSGYAHESSTTGEFKVGFFFDHATGMPLIPGSSVKGVLRAAFPGFTITEAKAAFDVQKLPGKKEDGEKLEQKLTKAIYSWWLIKGETVGAGQEKEHLSSDELRWLFRLEQVIFENRNDAWLIAGDEEKKTLEENKPRHFRDIFHDAYIVASHHHDKRVLASDFITPHKHKNRPALDPFANPVPVQFLKVLPDVDFCFQFRLVDDGNTELLSADDKKKLFLRLLQITGIGAKTNVGYGQFKRAATNIDSVSIPIISRKEQMPENFTGKPETGKPIQVKVISQVQRKVMIIHNGTEKTLMINRCPASLHRDGDLMKAKIGNVSRGVILDINHV